MTKKKTGRIAKTISTDREAWERLDKLSKELGINKSTLITRAIQFLTATQENTAIIVARLKD